jgi:isopentenyldiphosphate isomerase
MQPAYLDQLKHTVEQIEAHDTLTQVEITHLASTWRPRLTPQPTEEELFDVCDATGIPTGVIAPRWLCHLLGLRHRATHIILRSPQDLLVLQVRSSSKADWPDHIDTSVGGHVRAGETFLQAGHAEMEQELGLPATSLGTLLVGEKLEQVSQPYEHTDFQPGNPLFRNRQINAIYAGQLTPVGLAQIRFDDGEVSALSLCTVIEAQRLVEAGARIAPGLQHTLPRYIDWYHIVGQLC